MQCPHCKKDTLFLVDAARSGMEGEFKLVYTCPCNQSIMGGPHSSRREDIDKFIVPRDAPPWRKGAAA